MWTVRRFGWIAAPPLEGTLVVNLGDILQKWTHGNFCQFSYSLFSLSLSLTHTHTQTLNLAMYY